MRAVREVGRTAQEASSAGWPVGYMRTRRTSGRRASTRRVRVGVESSIPVGVWAEAGRVGLCALMGREKALASSVVKQRARRRGLAEEAEKAASIGVHEARWGPHRNAEIAQSVSFVV
jgi:hypothetical protein